MGVKARKISVVPFGVDASTYHPLNDLLPDEFFRVMTIIENTPWTVSY
ncbi:hypothetical protein [Mangrovivirga cuniculi]|nr:hypothetical protein [Mangrovivirga cuniculi]